MSDVERVGLGSVEHDVTSPAKLWGTRILVAYLACCAAGSVATGTAAGYVYGAVIAGSLAVVFVCRVRRGLRALRASTGYDGLLLADLGAVRRARAARVDCAPAGAHGHGAGCGLGCDVAAGGLSSG